MGQSYISVRFFSDDIVLDIHSATRADWLGRKRIGDIIGNKRASLKLSDRGEYLLELFDGPRSTGEFAEGPAVA